MDIEEIKILKSAKVKFKLLTFFIIIGLFICSLVLILWIYNIDFKDEGLAKQFSVLKYSIALSILFIYVLVRRRIRYHSIIKGFQIPSGEEIINQCKKEHLPYALYLRTFKSERVPNDITYIFDFGGRASSLDSRPVESVLTQLLSNKIPLITLPDPRKPVPKEGAHRLRKVHQDWPGFIRATMNEASFVILYVSELSSGIIQEIKEIKNLNIYNKTLIIFENQKVFEQAKEYNISSFEYKINCFSTTAKNEIFQQIAKMLNDISLKQGVKIFFDGKYKNTFFKESFIYYMKLLFLVPLILSFVFTVISLAPFLFLFYFPLITVIWLIILVFICLIGAVIGKYDFID